MKKVYTTNHSPGYASWLDKLGYEVTRDYKEADLLLITGGVDVNPSLYNQKRGHSTDHPHIERDRIESELFQYFLEREKKILGVCRGSQLACVLNGGELVQHSAHPFWHKADTIDGNTFNIISTHHQQALLRNIPKENYTLLAWANKLSPFHLDGNNDDYKFPDDYKEPEVVFYNKSKCLAIQSHPEMMSEDSAFVEWLRNLPFFNE